MLMVTAHQLPKAPASSFYQAHAPSLVLLAELFPLCLRALIGSPECMGLFPAQHRVLCSKAGSPTLPSQEAPHLLRYGLEEVGQGPCSRK